MPTPPPERSLRPKEYMVIYNKLRLWGGGSFYGCV